MPMLTISPEAQERAMKKGRKLYLEYIVLREGCCIPYQPRPVVRFGKPHNPAFFWTVTIEDITVFVPHELPNVPLHITVNSFIGFKWLSIEGWCHA
jgi:hypothetical protein